MNSTLRNAAVGMALAALGFSTSASAATATATAQANILTSLSVTATDALLDFGTVANSGVGGNVTVNAATGARTCTPGLVCTAGSPGVATFHVTGENGLPVGISFTNQTIQLQSGANVLPLTLASQYATLALGPSGGDFNVGGTLTLATNQAAGVYSGQFEVVVLYN
ncbi:DUF4402 domain-containing protein [Altererythrobacter sp. Root672]|uniref:DUF4402 domain-containing protein n=1 Tax=Altererythrobacter sp. Root672 TaxID=1736584 RepID=UPI0006F5BBAA|nr:DUF4402 domain-containing protein [Altererythrobacter sp. Root672]KRA81547.1 hypothetical protein ASD76_13505 [Altererythrobacter sp. Root672]